MRCSASPSRGGLGPAQGAGGVPSGGTLLIPESPRSGDSQEVPAVPSPCPVPQCPQLPTPGCLLNQELWIFPTIGALDRAKKTEQCLVNPGDLCEPPGLPCLCSCLWEKSFISSSALDALQEATASFWGGTGLWRSRSQGGQEGRLPPLHPDPKGMERPPRGSHGSRRVLSPPTTLPHPPESDFLEYFLLCPRMMSTKTRRRMKMSPTRAMTTRNHHSS